MRSHIRNAAAAAKPRPVTVLPAVESLDGEWRFVLDPDDRGRADGWIRRPVFPGRITVPGCWQAQGFGGVFKHAISQMGHPPLQVERHGYRGTGWYTRRFRVPAGWRGRRVWLDIGGVHPHAEFWCNGTHLGGDPGGLLEFSLDLTPALAWDAGNTVTVRVFDRGGENWGSACAGGIYAWSTVWSGLYRGVALRATGDAWIESAVALPDLQRGRARVRVALRRAAAGPRAAVAIELTVTAPDGRVVATARRRPRFEGAAGTVAASLAIPDAAPWSLESPRLYTLQVRVRDGETVLDERRERFGMRDIGVRGRKLVLNGTPLFLRGFGFNAVFPRTLAPDLDRGYIRKQFATARAFGFNAIDFYGVPYREFLEVADEVGILLQVFPGDILSHGLSRRAHLEALMRQVMNHPSIVCYGWSAEHYANEPEFVARIDALYAFAKRLDPTRLVLGRDGSGLANLGHGRSDFEELACCYRGCYRQNTLTQHTNRPVVIHELGWFSSYPNPRLKRKYRNTPLLPFHITLAEDVARRQGVAHLLPVFVRNSERLQAMERKMAIENLRQVPAIAGFHLWLGHDTVSAVEGIWDDFGDPKNVSAAECLRYNGDTVLLLDQDGRGQAAWVVPPDDAPETNPHDIARAWQGRNLWDDETLKVRVLVAHYGAQPLRNATLDWVLATAPGGRRLAGGRIAGLRVPRFTTARLGRLRIRVPALHRAVKTVLTVRLRAARLDVTNAWDFWWFPRRAGLMPDRMPGVFAYGRPTPTEFGREAHDAAIVKEPFLLAALRELRWDHPLITGAAPVAGTVVVSCNRLSNGLLDYLQRGGRVWLVTERLFPEYFHRFRSVPWHQAPYGNSGTIVQAHPSLSRFPHEGFCDLQFYDLARTTTARRLDEGGAINLDVWPARIEPIIRSIDSYMGARRRALLFEARVGAGCLLVSRLNFADTPAARFLAVELVRYLRGPGCRPKASVPPAFLRNFVQTRG